MAQETPWQATKQLAQSAFYDVANSYQQLLLTGHIYPSDRSNLNREIAEASYQQPELERGEKLFNFNHFHETNPPDLEPER